MRPIKVITFDLDDTLWAIGPVIREAERALWGWLEAQCPAMVERFTDRDGLGAIRSDVLEQSPNLIHDISTLRTLILTRALEQSGYGERAETLAVEAFEVFMHARHDVEYFEHAFSVLDELHRTYRLGVISNGNADVSRMDVGRYFDFAISAGDLGASKPNPIMFEAALGAAGCGPQDMVHIGDHHEHDIAGAKALDIRTVWVNRAAQRYPGDVAADAEIRSLDELPSALSRIGSVHRDE